MCESGRIQDLAEVDFKMNGAERGDVDEGNGTVDDECADAYALSKELLGPKTGRTKGNVLHCFANEFWSEGLDCGAETVRGYRVVEEDGFIDQRCDPLASKGEKITEGADGRRGELTKRALSWTPKQDLLRFSAKKSSIPWCALFRAWYMIARPGQRFLGRAQQEDERKH